LAYNIQLFIAKIKQFQMLQFHIGVTSTSVHDYNSEDGRLMGTPIFVDQNTPNLDQVLYKNLIIGTSGSGTEKPMDATYLALTEPNLSGPNQGFYRQSADLAVIYLTDAEDQSDEYVKAPSDLSDLLFKLKGGDGTKVHVYGAYVPSNVNNCDRDEDTLPVRLEEFFKRTNAITFSLCDTAFGAKLAAVGENLVSQIAHAIRLTKIPKPQTIKVNYGTQVIPNDARVGWTYNPIYNSIILGGDLVLSSQQPGTTLTVEFESR
jgi:hypothetical protein